MFRLQDPNNLVDAKQLERLRSKLDSALACLIKPSADGGNPFLYSLVATKTHELADTMESIPNWETAATDGDKYFWHPIFLNKLLPYEISIVMQHESIHIISEHVNRFSNKDPTLWAYCIDFCANAHLENDYRKSYRYSKAQTKYAIWSGNIGSPLSIEGLIKILRGHRAWPTTRSVFVDMKALHSSPESLYETLKPEWDNSSTRCKKCNSLSLNPRGQPTSKRPFSSDACSICGTKDNNIGPLDGHIKSAKSKQEILEELIGATERSNLIERGSVPSYVEDTINNLVSPSINLADHIRMACLRKSSNDGMQNDWKHFRRRALARGQYLPNRKSLRPKWLAMIDTSGSMSLEAITHGLSQLQSLGDDTDGIVVPCDAVVHWEHATEINDMSDLARTQIIGRGGTIFDSLFTEYAEKVGSDFDVIIIITDGLLPSPKIELGPPVDVLWAIVGKQDFNPCFGKVVRL
jgi:predicted metal-dependent peptidase